MTEVRPEELARTAKNAASMAAGAADCAQKAAERAAAYAEQVFDGKPMTTAEILGQYRRDLEGEGFPWATVERLVTDLACGDLHGRGVVISPKSEARTDSLAKAKRRVAGAVERQYNNHLRDSQAIVEAETELATLLNQVSVAAANTAG